MSLLDDVSIVVTPNGYKAGELYAVIPVPTEGAEEITNGDFATDTDWTKGTGWTISGGTANCNNTSGSTQNLQTENKILNLGGKRVQISFTVSNYSGSASMTVTLQGTGGNDFTGINANGTYTTLSLIAPTENNIDLLFKASNGWVGSIDNVSVKEVTRDNVPRIDYTGGGCPHILSEPQRTNLITYSEDFTQWDKNSGTTITLDSLISPDGTQNADLIVASGSGSRVGDNVSIVSGNTYTLSVYLKNNGGNTSITIGSYTTTQLETITINDEWNRYTTTFVASSTTTSSIRIISSGSNINLYAWGAQLEESYATSYIPTSGSTVTRNQDVFTRDGIGSLINSTEGVLFVEMAALSDDGTNRSITLSDGSTNNIIQILFSSVSNTIRFIIRVGGVGGDNLDKSTSTYTVTDFNKVALKWKQNDAQVWINGTQLGSPDTNSDVPTGLNDLSFEYLTVGNNFVGKVKQLQVYNTALTDEQLLQLTGTSGTDFYESYAEMASALTYTIQ